VSATAPEREQFDVRFVPEADIAAPFAAADWIFVLRYLGQKAHEFPSSMSAPGQDIEPC
jgi:hypothetical protein